MRLQGSMKSENPIIAEDVLPLVDLLYRNLTTLKSPPKQHVISQVDMKVISSLNKAGLTLSFGSNPRP